MLDKEPKIIGTGIEEIIEKVKKAIKEVQLMADEGESNVGIEKLDLTMKAYVEKEKGAKVEVKIPVVDLDAGFSGSLSEQETQIIQLTLVPVVEVGLFGSRGEIEQDLLNAILAIKAGLKSAAEGTPRFALQNASVELNFVVGRGGKLSFLAGGSRSFITTHTVKLYLGSQDVHGC